MKKTIFLLSCLGASLLAASPQFAPKPVSPRTVTLEKRTIPLVKEGKAQFALYVPRKAPAAIRRDAAEFAQYLSEIAGSKITPVHTLPADTALTVLRYGDN